MTAEEQIDVLDRAREAGKFPLGVYARAWERSHQGCKESSTPPEPVLLFARRVVREVEEFLGETLKDRMAVFTSMVLSEGYVRETSRAHWWIVGYHEALARLFAEMPSYEDAWRRP